MAESLARCPATIADRPGLCRLCDELSYMADDEGHVHPCCWYRADVIEQRGFCPACAGSRAAGRQRDSTSKGKKRRAA